MASAAATNGSWGQSYAYDGFGNLTDQTVIADSIANLPARLNAEKPSGPVLVMIGSVAAGYQLQRDLAVIRHQA